MGDGVFIFDEFAKNFGSAQDEMLDFFSGAYACNRAVFVIENSEWDINNFMKERPGRLRYHYSYGKLPMDVVKEVCQFREVPENITNFIQAYAARSRQLSMDTLTCIVDECLYDVDAVASQEAFNNAIEEMNVPSVIDDNMEVARILLNNEEILVKDCSFVFSGEYMNCILPNDTSSKAHAFFRDTTWYSRAIKAAEKRAKDNERPVNYAFSIQLGLKFDLGKKRIYENAELGLQIEGQSIYSLMDNSHALFI